MPPAGARGRAAALRRLHEADELLVLLNVWDAASARTVAAAPGCRALATASWSIAAAYGHADGEEIAPADMLAAVRRIAGAVELPVSADLESGYGDTADDVAEVVGLALDAGAVGCNLEDWRAGPAGGLREAEHHAELVAAACSRAEAAGVPAVINARTDVFLREVGDPATRLDAALVRGRAYREAGADCIFVPGVADPETIGRLARDLGAPLSVLAVPGSPGLDELARLGVARVSFGPGTMGVALGALAGAAETLLARGPLPAGLGYRPPAG